MRRIRRLVRRRIRRSSRRSLRATRPPVEDVTKEGVDNPSLHSFIKFK